MGTALGVNSKLVFKRQTAKGTIATVGSAQVLRRETALFELKKETYTTESEITATQQLLSNRHGVKSVDGKVSGILSPNTYSDFLSAALRREWAAVTPVASVGLTIAGAGPTYTVTRAAGSYWTDGFKVGQVVRFSVGGLNAANLAKNVVIIGLTATVATVMPLNGVALVAEGPISGCTITATGKCNFVPDTGHTNIFYTVETWDADVPSSERNLDCKVASVSLAMPGSGNAKIDLSMIGLDQTYLSTVYFTTPTVETSTPALVSASGVLVVAGAAVATVTDLSINIDCKEQPADAVVGSNIRPDVFRGKVMVTGSFTAYFDSVAFTDLFRNETSSSLIVVLAADSTATSKFIAVTIPALDVNSITPTDGETGKKRTYNFVAEYNSVGGTGTGTEKTTIYFQDTDA